MLMGFGIFNLVEGIIDHHLLGLHHVNETAPPEQWLWWDLGFRAAAGEATRSPPERRLR